MNTINLVMTDECYDKYFLQLPSFDVDCFKAFLSTTLGYLIILGAILVKLPQIYKIATAENAQGVSFPSLLLEICAVSATLSYSYAKGFPFSAWGDTFFVMMQDAVVGFLIQYYNDRTRLGAAFVIIFSAVLFVLVSGLTPIAMLAVLQASNLPVVAISKLMQAWDNYANGNTGQLSAITVFLTFCGSLSRIFTSIQETGDELVILNYVAATFCNVILVAQVAWYWNVKIQTKED